MIFVGNTARSASLQSAGHRHHRAAVTWISIFFSGPCSSASTQARAGVLPGTTQASHTLFISSTVRMSESQMVAVRSFDLSVPALARNAVDDREDFAGLLGDPLAERLVGGQPGEIDGSPCTTTLLMRGLPSMR